MKTQTRKAVSPIIATLLLIAITVAAGVVVYVFVGGLSANLSKSGGNQVTEQISLDAYTTTVGTASTNGTITMTLRNSGSAGVTIASVYLDGVALAKGAVPASLSVSPQSTITIPITGLKSTGFYSHTSTTLETPAFSAGGSYQVKVVTLDGAIFTFNVIAGSSG